MPKTTNQHRSIPLTLGLAVCWGSALLSSGGVAQVLPGREVRTTEEPAFSEVRNAPKTQARVYVFRAPESPSAAPINLYINGRYHTSLLRGGFSEFCISSSNWQLQTALDDARRLHSGKLDIGHNVQTSAGKVLFLQVQDNSSRGAFVRTLPESEAVQTLKKTYRQGHTISRAPLVEECAAATTQVPAAVSTIPPQVPPAPRTEAPAKEYALETDAVFEFGKTELRPTGFNAIENLLQQVRLDYKQIDRVKVVGYTDSIGPEKLNRKLSLLRAQSVSDRLKLRGLQAARGIHAEGQGSEELVKTHCGRTPTPANKACQAPNRRVTIVIYGTQR